MDGLYRAADGRVVGKREDDGWVYKKVDPVIHHLNAYGAWAIEKAHLAQMESERAHGIRLRLPDGMLEARLPVLQENCWHVYPGMEEGQVAMKDKHWHRAADPRQGSLL